MIYIRIEVVSGKKKDTIQHATEDVKEAIAFIEKHTKVQAKKKK